MSAFKTILKVSSKYYNLKKNFYYYFIFQKLSLSRIFSALIILADNIYWLAFCKAFLTKVLTFEDDVTLHHFHGKILPNQSSSSLLFLSILPMISFFSFFFIRESSAILALGGRGTNEFVTLKCRRRKIDLGLFYLINSSTNFQILVSI